MSYFNENKLEKVRWRCSLNLEKYFEKPLRGFYNKEHEYVATWYENRLSLDKSKTLVDVTFINLTKPTYINKKTGEECQSFFRIALPINYLHKVPFGSIWKNGESEYKFKFKEFKVTFSKSEGLTYKPLWTDKVSHPFEADKYVHSSYLNSFKRDGNQLLVIKTKGENKSYIVHPLHFFMAHYGYSSELKRILITDNWSKVEKKLRLNESFEEKGVFIPNNLSTKDAVFLYHLKYDAYTKAVVKDVSTRIVLSKNQEKPKYLIPCWHDQPITLSFYGVELGNSVLCCQITGISQPKGEPINLYYHSVIKVSKDGQGQDTGEIQYRTRIQEREHELEKLDISLDNVNNLVTADVIEYLSLLGEQREINRIQLAQENFKNGKVKLLNYDEPENYSTGEKQGKTGLTGIANCFYDIANTDEIEGKSRLEEVWKHAKRLRHEQNADVYWYTPKRGFNESDNFTLVSLEDILKSLKQSYPSVALILRVNVQRRTFFVLSFPEKDENENSGFSSVVYEPQNIQHFLSGDRNVYKQDGNLFKLFTDIVSSGGVSSDYVDSKDGKMSLFRHREAKKTNNNWVWNGIKKLF
ncbi:TPA: hypothetical protein QB266_002087 [Pasteurella multocida]|uniref:hypothetical protein n=1 Tax=Pasteurella multocida TaxID=747 RepID=UPI000DA28DCA|nr:hypothetical protein [Pasteurella multocida]MDT8779074.1 hypothetical protein [Pasteurella multocida]MDX3898433.1 hypothetical protein [Pasteurella multocida]MDX3956250.1 hypothetical protein [Pasteurella multocida]MDY0669552.1 hypothetical protein [Pasteurella multocida]NNI38559.1 hypothetical protein [Pasteurella multocida]